MIRDVKSEDESSENEEIAVMAIGSSLEWLEHNGVKVDFLLRQQGKYRATVIRRRTGSFIE